MSFESLTEAV